MRKASYKKVLLELYEDTDIQKMNINELYLARLVKKADKKIEGLYTLQVAKQVVEVKSSEILLPEDAFNIDYILLGDYTEDNMFFVNTDAEHIITLEITDAVDNSLNYRLWSDISFPNISNKIDFVLANNKININSVYNGETVTIFYTRYPVNEKGEFMVNENHIEAISSWMKYHLFSREMFRKKMTGGRLFNDDFAFMRELKSNKNLHIRNARVEDRRLNEDFVTKNLVINKYNAFLENEIY